jgi:hypothetical protein
MRGGQAGSCHVHFEESERVGRGLEKTQDSHYLGDKFMKLVMKLAYKILEGELCASVPACINIERKRCRTVHHMGTLRTDVVRARS